MTRHLVRGEGRLEERQQRNFIDRASFVCDHARNPDLPHNRVVPSDHRDVGNVRVLADGRLDLGGRHIKTVRLVALAQPVKKGQPAIGVQDARITRVQPTVAVDRRGGLHGFLVIPLHDAVPADPDLSDLAGRLRIFRARLDHPEFDAGQRVALRREPDVLRVVPAVARRHRCGFSEAVTSHDPGYAQPVRNEGKHLEVVRQDVGHPDRGQRLRVETRQPADGQHHGRQQVRHRATLALCKRDELRCIETFGHDDRAAPRPEQQHAVHHGHRTKQGDGEEQAILFGLVDADPDIPRLAEHAVGDQRAFRERRRSGTV